MQDYLDSLLEKSDDGNKNIVTTQKQSNWLKLMEDSKQAACKRYLELYPDTDISASVTAQIWIEGFQMGYIGMLIAAYLDDDAQEQEKIEAQVEIILRRFARKYNGERYTYVGK